MTAGARSYHDEFNDAIEWNTARHQHGQGDLAPDEHRLERRIVRLQLALVHGARGGDGRGDRRHEHERGRQQDGEAQAELPARPGLAPASVIAATATAHTISCQSPNCDGFTTAARTRTAEHDRGDAQFECADPEGDVAAAMPGSAPPGPPERGPRLSRSRFVVSALARGAPAAPNTARRARGGDCPPVTAPGPEGGRVGYPSLSCGEG